MRPACLVVLGALALLLAAPSGAAAEPTRVEVGLLVINFGNYDMPKGTYTMDFYLWMRWNASAAPQGFSPERFEFMNGRAVGKDRIFDSIDATTGVHEVWYRVQANLYSEPHFDHYPYDTQELQILFEDSVNDANALEYVPLVEASGLDDIVHVAGWRIGGWSMETDDKEYKFGETYSRVLFSVHVSRVPLSTTLKTFLPAAAFAVVSALSFFFHPSKVAQRIALGTSMLISAVMYHVSQTINLPPLGKLILFDKVMLSLYTFLAGSLIVTALIAIDEDFWKDRDHTKEINSYGAVAAVVLPVVTYGALSLF